MSIYQQAVVSGGSAVQLALTGSNAQTTEAFNAGFAAQAQRIAAADRKNVAERNIGAIKQDTILTNIDIQLKQDEAEAFAKVNAAASGVKGQSVSDVIYQTEANESFAIARNRRRSEQLIESQLSRVNAAQNALLSVEETQPDVIGELLGAFSSVTRSDLSIGEALLFGDADDSLATSAEAELAAEATRILGG